MQSISFRRVRNCGLLALFAFAIASTGCAKFGKVHGTVTYLDGKTPLGAGHVVFIKVGGKGTQDRKTTDIQSDGQYTIDAPLGKCKVVIENDYINQLNTTMPGGGMGGGGAPGGKVGISDDARQSMKDKAPSVGPADDSEQVKANIEKKKLYRPLPADYDKEDKTPLEFDVQKGSNEYDIPIKGTPQVGGRGPGT